MREGSKINKKRIILFACELVLLLIILIIALACSHSKGDNAAEGKTVDIYFVRHAKTDANSRSILAGSGTDAALIKEGIKQAEAAGRYLSGVKFDGVYTSQLTRTKDTADIILRYNNNKKPDVTVLSLLDDISWGEAEGLTVDEALHRYPDFSEDNYLGTIGDDSFVSPIGATSKNTKVREYIIALEDIIESAADDDNVLVVSHSSFVWYLQAAFPEEVASDYIIPNSSITIIRFVGDKPKLVQLGLQP